MSPGRHVRDPRRRPAKARPAKSSPGPRALPALDRLIHERMRLGIVSALAASESLTFRELRKLLGASDGNLSVHARRLEDAGYVACTKTFEGRVPKTVYRLSAEGRRAFERYLAHLEAVIEHAREK
jgi:DNA-binding transcriptional ArsR family regulator